MSFLEMVPYTDDQSLWARELTSVGSLDDGDIDGAALERVAALRKLDATSLGREAWK